VSDFRLDKYPVTTGRFRRFVSAVVDGWRPLGGWGRHTHVNDGRGLTGTNSEVEPGWNQDFTPQLATTHAEWNANLLHQGAGLAAWTETAGAKEARPINFVTWYEAYAFCIWDGGFLASDAEWNYAAAGGSEQRVYPWSSPPSSELIDCGYGWYSGCTGNSADVGAHSPKGDGRFGQVDLVGGGYAWILDFTGDYSTPCVDCTNTQLASGRSARGASLASARDAYLVSARMGGAPTSREDWFGARCARRP